MSYGKWMQEHAAKHKRIVKKLLQKGYDKEQIIDYFDFENLVKNESDFCPLYKEKKKCHNVDELNCYLCACPNFRFNDKGIDEIDGKTRYSFCSIDSKDGKASIYGEALHQDCSGCIVTHTKAYVRKHFKLDWMEIMQSNMI